MKRLAVVVATIAAVAASGVRTASAQPEPNAEPAPTDSPAPDQQHPPDEPQLPPQPPSEEPKQPKEPGQGPAPDRKFDRTAKDSDGAPIPGNESGRLDQVDSGDGVGRQIARGVLWIPRGLLYVVYLPIHFGFLLTDRYHVDKLYYKIFYNANHTIGIVPTAVFVSGFGLSVGARFVATNALGNKERFSVQATTGVITGETYREGAVVEAHSGNWLGKHVELGVIADVDRRPADPFYGIGNGNQTSTIPAGAPIDPRINDAAYEVYNRYQEERVGAGFDFKPTLETHIELNGALTKLEYAQSNQGTPIGAVYNTADIPGFLGGVEHAYGELDASWDTRRRANIWEPLQEYTRGGLIAGYVGREHRLDNGGDFWRYGGELQKFFRLGTGPRALLLRLRGAGVSGDTNTVPFSELPMLGGGDFLRGYSYARFRDRVAAFGTIQYEWDLSHFVGAYLFTDIGRVYDSVDELTLDHMRVGYGIGLDIHGEAGFLFTATLASSIDGGIFTTLTFNQAINGLQRWR